MHVGPFQAHSTQFLNTVALFLAIAKRHDHHVVLVLFDDCWKPEYHMGQQPDPIPGVHNSQWVQCPGETPIEESVLQNYVISVVTRFRNDETVVMWDLYN